MRNVPGFTPARISGWVLSFIIFFTVLALSGKLATVLSHAVYALALAAGIAAAGELLARLNARPAAAAPGRADMRALIAPYYATLRRTVQAQEDEAAAGDAAAARAAAYEFDAATASVVADEMDGYPDASGHPVYAIKRYARSAEGEYFWMVLEVGADGVPRLAFIKHVPHRVARYALKGRYIAPPAA